MRRAWSTARREERVAKPLSRRPFITSRGRGAMSPRRWGLSAKVKRSGTVSQTHWLLRKETSSISTEQTGTATATRSSTAARYMVWFPPPETPVTPIRAGSTSGRALR